MVTWQALVDEISPAADALEKEIGAALKRMYGNLRLKGEVAQAALGLIRDQKVESGAWKAMGAKDEEEWREVNWRKLRNAMASLMHLERNIPKTPALRALVPWVDQAIEWRQQHPTAVLATT